MAGDPANLVQPELRPHIHLVSSFKCENKSDPFSLTPKEIVQLLVRAALETKGNDESWCWKMLEVPRDRTALIVWQSTLQQSGRQFPSDGYVWADVEEVSIQQIDGLKLECYQHRSGYVPSYEQYTLHARSRYRVLPANNNPAHQGCDPCLWLVLYRQAEKSRILHVRKIPELSIQNQKIILDQRRMILQNGTPKSKDFIWEDRSHWPDIKFPQNQSSHRSFGSNVISRSQQGPYLAGQQLLDPRTGQPSSKRMKPSATTSTYVFPNGEDDGGNGDVMDVLVPRDISRLRYKQHAEWMEELYASPYSVTSLHPVSLGIGRNGSLSVLGTGIGSLDTPTSVESVVPAKKISSADFDQYVKNTHEKISELQSEISVSKDLHLRKIAKARQGSALQGAEKRLRGTAYFAHLVSSSPELESTNSGSSEHKAGQQITEIFSAGKLDEFDRVIQSIRPKPTSRIEPLHLRKLISKGGLEEKTATAPNPVAFNHIDSDDNVSRLVMSRSPPSTQVIGADSPATSQPYRPNTEDAQDATHPDDDYVMIDKTSHINEPVLDDAMDTSEIQGHENDADGSDGVDGDEFLNFDGENHDDNFDSMFTDAIGSGDGAGSPDDAAVEGLGAVLESTSSEEPIYTENLPRPPTSS